MNDIIEKLKEVDWILSLYEDWMHGTNGVYCTEARKLLNEVMSEVKLSTNETLKIQYQNVCNEYVNRFSEKHDIEFDGWVGDEVGGIASFVSQYFFNISDIVFDIDTNQPVHLILKWQEDGVDYNMFRDKSEYINYKSYTMGLRYEDLENNIINT